MNRESDAVDLLKRIQEEWVTSKDPVILYNTGEFKENIDRMNKHIHNMNLLMEEALTLIQHDE